MKSVGIDCVKTGKGEKNDKGEQEKLAKYKVFERQYDEYLEPDNLRQVLQTALLMDPDVAVQYYPRTDQLLLLLYNKVNGSKRHSENKEKPHGILGKLKTAPCRTSRRSLTTLDPTASSRTPSTAR